jgi:hypothetical protein
MGLTMDGGDDLVDGHVTGRAVPIYTLLRHRFPGETIQRQRGPKGVRPTRQR